MRRRVKIFLNKPQVDKIILEEAKKQNQIIYGARAIQKHLGTISRETQDYDIFTSNPKKSAYKTEKLLDNSLGFDHYYTKKGVNKTTWKVKSKGFDLKKGTQDDEGIADYTQTPKPKPKTVIYNGINYRALQEEVKGKKMALADKQFAFRHEKDRRDLTIIKSVLNAGKLQVQKFPKIKL